MIFTQKKLQARQFSDTGIQIAFLLPPQKFLTRLMGHKTVDGDIADHFHSFFVFAASGSNKTLRLSSGNQQFSHVPRLIGQ